MNQSLVNLVRTEVLALDAAHAVGCARDPFRGVPQALFGGQPLMDQISELRPKMRTGTWHFQIKPGLGAGGAVARPEPVRNREAREIPILFDDRNQAGMFDAVHAVQAVIGQKHPDTVRRGGHFEGQKIGLAQGSLVYQGAHPVTLGLGIVAHGMFGDRARSRRLKALNPRRAKGADQVGIFGKELEISARQR